jgi:hypothetical protein
LSAAPPWLRETASLLPTLIECAITTTVPGKDASVLEPPSELLWQRLREGALCGPGDLRRARRLVRKLARDLPAFDTVWIDALVQSGRITPYQARLLESEPAAPLRRGDFLLHDELGRGARSQTWLVRRGRGGPWLVLKRLQLPPGQLAPALQQAQTLVALARQVRHPALVLPCDCAAEEDALLIVSPFVNGLPLSELLVRRGRFPGDVVSAIALQLASGLSAGHSAGLIHGAIRRSHVRVNGNGQAVFVETGCQSFCPSDITVHAPLALEAYDGIAPELIGVGRTVTAASDWYALGCLLWELLAGRPPFPTADPLAKLAAHQSHTVDDVRERAPDTPEPLARLIRGLTQREPEQRRAAADIFLEQMGPPSRRGLRTVARFRQAFDAAVPHLRTAQRSERWFWPTVWGTGCLFAAIILYLSDFRVQSVLLALPARWAPTAALPPAGDPLATSADLAPLPAPSPEGTIVLTSRGPYAAATIRFPGTLLIRAEEGVCPEILIRDQPLRIAAEQWKCEGVRFRCDRLFRGVNPAPVLVDVIAQRVTWQGCALDLGDRGRRFPADREVVGVHWRTPSAEVTTTGPRWEWRNCLLSGTGTMLHVESTAAQVRAINVLHLGPAVFLSCAAMPLDIELDRVTFRNSGPVVRCLLEDPTQNPRLRVSAERSILQVSPRHSVLEVVALTQPVLTEEAFAWRGDDTWLTANGTLLSWVNSATHDRRELPTDFFMLEGLAVGDVRFSGLPTQDPAASVAVAGDMPRHTTDWPGITAEGFGPCLTAPVTPRD